MHPISCVDRTSRCPLSRSFLALVLLIATGLLPALGAAPSDPEAVAVAQRVMEALGGRQAWEQTRYIRFDFAGRRSHWWDRHTGRHRVEGTTRDGKSFIVLHNLHTREGEAFLDGRKLSGDEEETWLDNAYAMWVNDTYWLLMPYKMQDPGVTLAYAGTEELDGTPHDVIRLSFDGVGLTPGDRYWVWVDRESGLVDQWGYVLQDEDPDKSPTRWRWHGWERHGDILLASGRTRIEDGRELPLEKIAVDDELPDEVFESPEPVELD